MLKKITFGGLGLFLLASPALAFAQTPPLADDYGTGTVVTGSYCPQLSITMQRGARDSTTSGQVSELQAFLADHFQLNEEDIISGYFGRLTESHVIKFQKNNSLPSFGIVGSMTRATIAAVCYGGTSTCKLDGATVGNGASRTFYSSEAAASGTACTAISLSRTCNNGVLDGDTSFNKKSCSDNLSCPLDGTTVKNGESKTFYSSESADFNSTCDAISESRTCNNGTLSGGASFNKKSCSVPNAQSCKLDGRTVQNGAYRDFYNASTVPFGSTCAKISRLCTNGTLNGDAAYNKESCSVAHALPCNLDGATVKNGDSKTFYSSEAAASGTSCTAISRSRTCNNGTLSDSATFNKKSCSDSTSCPLDGVTVNNGSSRDFFNASTVAFGSTCTKISRKCTNGTLEGDATFNKASCSVASAASCPLDGVTVNNGNSKTFYSANTPPVGQTCAQISQSRICTNGLFPTASDAYNKASCTPTTCILDGVTVKNGDSKTFYSKNPADPSTSCGSVSQSRKCTNGALSGDAAYVFASCTVASADFSTTATVHRGKNGQKFIYKCPASATSGGAIHGTDVYTDDSSVCLAGVHAGAISKSGGTIEVEIKSGKSFYKGSTRNGVTSFDYPTSYDGSFSVSASGESEAMVTDTYANLASALAALESVLQSLIKQLAR